MTAILLILVGSVLSKLIQFEHEKEVSSKIVALAKQTIVVVMISILLSPVLVYTLALVELNIMAMAININPKIVGVKTDVEEIETFLLDSTNTPQILKSDKGLNPGLVTVAMAAAGKDNFFSQRILPSLPNMMVMPVAISDDPVLLVDNFLILKPQKLDEISRISPALIYRLVKNQFSNREIKAPPKLLYASREEYNKYRIQDLEEKLLKMEQELGEFENETELIQAQIEADKEMIVEKKEALNQIYRNREAEYQKCLGEDISEVICKDNLKVWDDQIIEANGEVTFAQTMVEEGMRTLSDIQDYIKVNQAQKSAVKLIQESVVQEYGQFVPPDEIYITREDMQNRTLTEYLETITHEYLHYSSFISQNRTLSDSFWEEGLTEYFARKAIEKSLQEKTNIGYPAAVKIITQVSRRIDDSELAEIYFGKDQTLLEETLDRVYGDGFYQETRIYFTLLQYSSNPEQILKYANTIMERIDGPKLDAEDVLSGPVS